MPLTRLLRRAILVLPFASTLLASPRPLAGQPSPKFARATRLAPRPPRIDGRLDDAAWQGAEVISDFQQQRPLEGAAPSERTEVRILYDESAIYIGARMFRRDPSRIFRTVTRRDGTDNAERITITFDTHHDFRTGYGFSVSAAGVRGDYHHSQDSGEQGKESQYDPVWDAQAVVDSAGWSAEMRIPFSQLRFPAMEHQAWGLQVDRWMPDRNEFVQWVMIPARETGFISRFGTLVGMDGIHPTRPVELLPYIAGDATRRGVRDAANPFSDAYRWRGGLDAKFGIGSNLTVDATVNPDFGQVEADPAEVNLSAFESIFEERRPFFTEGAELLRAQGPNYFYSRRIGGAPHYAPVADYVDVPRASTILGAAKITGRLASRQSIGALLAVTGAENARTFFVDSGTQRTVRAEPRTAYAVVRLQQEVGRQASTIGATFTGVRRQLGGDHALDSLLNREAYAGGVDWRWRFQQGRYAITGFAGGSYALGDSLDIRRIQESSAHYFQRPDQHYLGYDPSRTALGGYSASIRADKDAGRHTLWGAQISTESPGYDVNDAGRLQSADDIDYNADFQLRETIPGRYLRSWRVGVDTRGAYNYGHDHQINEWNNGITVTFNNFWNASIRTGLQLRGSDDALTRGGPVMATPFGWRQELRLANAAGSRTGWRLMGDWRRDELGGSGGNLSGMVALHPAPQWQLSVEPGYQRAIVPRQYVGTFDGGSALTYGGRYVFAFIDRSTFFTRLRLNYAFSPTLTLEGYGEPFAASGHYRDFGELQRARSSALRVYGTEGTTVTLVADTLYRISDGSARYEFLNPDFNVHSFRSNLVLRWEWNPGSTLFVVWQQNRLGSTISGDPVSVRDLWRTTRATGDNFISVKLSYWIPVAARR